MHILIIGGLGYTGSVLTNHLLNDGNKISIIDSGWFGDHIKKNSNLKKIKIDIRNISKLNFRGIDKVVHLANIPNDPSVDLNPSLSWEVNALSTKLIVEKCIQSKVKHFIYASSGSVYGVKKEKKVTEKLSLSPISIYNKTKMVSEKVIESYKDEINYHIIRPATVCGVSPRMRFDVSVNLLTLQALKKKQITVFGGNQIRPNIHLKDMIRIYEFFIKKKIPSGFYNAGFENLKIINIAKMIQRKTNAKIKIIKSNDPRSYRQDSSKLIDLGYERKYGVNDAIEEIINLSKKKKIKVNQSNFTVKWMKKLKIQ